MTDIRYNRQWYRLGISHWCRWLAGAQLLWWFLGIVIIASIVGDWVGCACGETRVERLPIAGWMLEVGGIGVTAYALARKFSLYSGVGIGTQITTWLRKFPMFKQSRVLEVGMATEINVATHAASVTTRGQPPDNATIEDRVSRLERLIEKLREELTDLRRRAGEENSKLRTELLDQIEAVRSNLDEDRTKTVKANVEDVGWEAVGILWVIVGVTFATVPQLVLWLPPVRFLIDTFTVPVSCPL